MFLTTRRAEKVLELRGKLRSTYFFCYSLQGVYVDRKKSCALFGWLALLLKSLISRGSLTLQWVSTTEEVDHPCIRNLIVHHMSCNNASKAIKPSAQVSVLSLEKLELQSYQDDG